jgi:hypothetical protein
VLEGFKSEVDRFAQDAAELRELRVKFTESGLPEADAERFRDATGAMEQSLKRREERLREGLRAAAEAMPGDPEVAEQWVRVDEAAKNAREQPGFRR